MRVAWVCAAAVAAALDPNVLEAFRSGDADHDARLDPDEFEAALASLYVARARTGAIAPPAPAAPRKGAAAAGDATPAGGAGFARAFVNSMGMIWATEVGDKTFFIAAILAMRHARLVVFAGALGALAVMTVLSALLGLALPSLLPRTYTHYASAGLFLYFGLRLLRDARSMETGTVSEELEEVEEELGVGAGKKQDAPGDAEAGGAAAPRPPRGRRRQGRGAPRALAGVRAHLPGGVGRPVADRDDRARGGEGPVRRRRRGRRGPRHVHGPRGRGRPHARGAHQREARRRLRRPDLPGVRGLQLPRRGPPGVRERHTTLKRARPGGVFVPSQLPKDILLADSGSEQSTSESPRPHSKCLALLPRRAPSPLLPGAGAALRGGGPA